VKVTDAMKVLAQMWRDLAPEKRAEYNKIAEDDKSRYFAEMKSYTGPMHVPNKRQKKPPVRFFLKIEPVANNPIKLF